MISYAKDGNCFKDLFHNASVFGLTCMLGGALAGKAIYLLKIVPKEVNPLAVSVGAAAYTTTGYLLVPIILGNQSKSINQVALIIIETASMVAGVATFMTVSTWSFNASIALNSQVALAFAVTLLLCRR